MSCCVGCNKLGKGCSTGCMDYLLQSLTSPREMKIKDLKKDRVSFNKKFAKMHTYLGGNE